MVSIREIVLGWDTSEQPTQKEYDAAKFWIQVTRGNIAVGASDKAKIKELIRRYEYNHPDIFPR